MSQDVQRLTVVLGTCSKSQLPLAPCPLAAVGHLPAQVHGPSERGHTFEKNISSLDMKWIMYDLLAGLALEPHTVPLFAGVGWARVQLGQCNVKMGILPAVNVLLCNWRK